MFPRSKVDEDLMKRVENKVKKNVAKQRKYLNVDEDDPLSNKITLTIRLSGTSDEQVKVVLNEAAGKLKRKVYELFLIPVEEFRAFGKW